MNTPNKFLKESQRKYLNKSEAVTERIPGKKSGETSGGFFKKNHLRTCLRMFLRNFLMNTKANMKNNT